jgi:enoyl-CoA hydratase
MSTASHDGTSPPPRGGMTAAVPHPDAPDPMVVVEWHGDVAVLRLDDGKVNALSRRTIRQFQDALDAAADARAIAVVGRPRMLSAGLDLAEVRADPATQRDLRNDFMALALRLFTTDVPVVVGCTGHALAAGAALLLAADRRLGSMGAYRIGFSEVAAGLALSAAAVELVRYRLAMPWFESILTGSVFDPEGAAAAGFLDDVVEDAVGAALAEAARLATLDPRAFAVTKRTARRDAAHRIGDALDRSRSRGSDQEEVP